MSQLSDFAIDLLRLIVWLALLTAIFLPLERLFALDRRDIRWNTLPADMAYYFLNSLLPIAILAPPLALISLRLRQVTPAGSLPLIASLPLWAKLMAAFIVGEIGGYWAHRACHEIPFLWRFHQVHHAPDHVYWLMSTRAHPVDQVVQKLGALTPLYVLGLVQPTAEGGGLATYLAVFGFVWGVFIHANVRWRLGPLEWLVSTPAFHHWPHTNDAYRDHNYSALFPVVDRLFGTHYLPKHWPPSYGVDATQPASLLEQLLVPLSLGRRPQPVTPSDVG